MNAVKSQMLIVFCLHKSNESSSFSEASMNRILDALTTLDKKWTAILQDSRVLEGDTHHIEFTCLDSSLRKNLL